MLIRDFFDPPDDDPVIADFVFSAAYGIKNTKSA
jgi:hypothetical protein